MPISPSYLFRNLKKVPCLLRSRRQLRFYLNRTLWETGFPWTDITPQPLNEIFPDMDSMVQSVELIFPLDRKRGTSIELDELVAMLMIVRFSEARNILEIGTFDGNTAINFAANTGNDGTIVTIDLPPEDSDDHTELKSASSVPAKIERRQYVGHSLESKIQQVYADSAQLDWSTLDGEFDLIFIDGDHSCAYVESDTANSLSVLRPGGIILWHDYDWPSVAKVLNTAIARGVEIKWILGTRLAVATFDSPRDQLRHFQSL